MNQVTQNIDNLMMINYQKNKMISNHKLIKQVKIKARYQMINKPILQRDVNQKEIDQPNSIIYRKII